MPKKAKSKTTERSTFDLLNEGLDHARAIRRGELAPGRVTKFEPIDVRAIRERVQMSQAEFAAAIHVSTRTLQNWEQRHRNPTGPAIALLKIVERAPDVAVKVLQSA
ncbi:NadS family protein [Achromobacter deleyi]|uniref:NadS family protein n=1 Tax=Achromobacter deleyi TaxID=1353891 RepID=UPI001E4D74F1|nr:NadS family protein [Achromobacter deleyi]